MFLDLCREHNCDFYGRCEINQHGKPECLCPTDCEGVSNIQLQGARKIRVSFPIQRFIIWIFKFAFLMTEFSKITIFIEKIF